MLRAGERNKIIGKNMETQILLIQKNLKFVG